MKNWLAPNPTSRPPSPSCKPCSTPSSTSTTTTARTAPSPHRATPAAAYQPDPKPPPATAPPTPTTASATTASTTAGNVTLRHHGRLHHIGIGRTHARTPVILLIHDLDIRIIHAATGELLRDLTLDPTSDYQPTGAPPGPPNENETPNPKGSGRFRCPETSQSSKAGIEPARCPLAGRIPDGSWSLSEIRVTTSRATPTGSP